MILIHVCCGPCLLYPLSWFKEKGIEVLGYFYNPNIHPYREFKVRVKALEQVETLKGIKIIWDKTYGLRFFVKETFMVCENPEKRCERCYVIRLRQTVKKALELKAEAFTTTLLYSIYQKHNLIKEIAEDLSHKYRIPFFYEDFRKGYKLGQEEAITFELYRQSYCGCIFSEEERYSKARIKELKKMK